MSFVLRRCDANTRNVMLLSLLTCRYASPPLAFASMPTR